MEQCHECGAPCGKRHPLGWMNNHDFLCDSCARKRQSNGVKAFGGFLFLLFAVALSVIVSITILKPIVSSSGYATAKGLSIGLGIGGVVLFFILRYSAGKTSGCLVRIIIKMVGFIVYALGVGLLFLTFLMEGQFKGLVGVKDSDSNTSTVSDVTRPTEAE